MVDGGQVEIQQPTPTETVKPSQDLGRVFRGKEEYPKLPSELSFEDKLLGGIENLRPTDSSNLVERGGVIIQTPTNEIAIVEGGRPGEVFGLVAPEITEDNIADYLEGQVILFRDGKPLKDMLIVDWQVLDKNRAYFKSLMDQGMKVVIGSMLGKIHSHPSGNLPSPTDAISALFPLSEGKKSEAVVTGEWTYFIVPTIQTPDLFLTDPYRNVLQQLDKDDEETAKQQKLGSYPPGEGPQNAWRLKMIQDLCTKNSAGFYSLKRGDKAARRVF